MAKQSFSLSIEIESDIDSVFSYITDPNKWHEWYPSSIPTDISYSAKNIGDTFAVGTTQKPIGFLPYRMDTKLNYVVTKCTPPSEWQATAKSELIDSVTTYNLESFKGRSRLTRTFDYDTKGLLRILEPILLRKKIRSQAELGLEQLKKQLEDTQR